MKSFKRFLKDNNVFLGTKYTSFVLKEELTPEQKSIVDSWGPSDAAEKISGHVIPKGQHRITIPLETPQEQKSVASHPDVEGHLKQHGYDIHDYKAGLALEPVNPGQSKRRLVRIGAALKKTGASEEVKNAFINDPARRAAKQENTGLQIVISHHPYHVAGMSTDQGWTSCMNMEGGSNCHYLEADVKKGTHVAYLTHEGDHEAKKPLARIALKPFHSGNHTVLRPEGRTYGTADLAFHDTVRKWAENNFPVDDDEVYEKDRDVYHDGGPRTIMSFERAINHPDDITRASAFEDHADKITPDHITKALEDHSMEVRHAAISHPLANEKHITKALNDPEVHVRNQAIRHPNVNADHITKALNHESTLLRQAAISHPNATEDHITHVLNNEKNSYVRAMAIRHPKATSEHITKALNDPDKFVRKTAIERSNAA